MNAYIVISKTFIIPYNGPVGTVRYVYAMLVNGIGTNVIFYQDIICKSCKNASLSIIVAITISDNAVV
jgi:hypothetical protein